jgi:hypothetical protein
MANETGRRIFDDYNRTYFDIELFVTDEIPRHRTQADASTRGLRTPSWGVRRSYPKASNCSTSAAGRIRRGLRRLAFTAAASATGCERGVRDGGAPFSPERLDVPGDSCPSFRVLGRTEGSPSVSRIAPIGGPPALPPFGRPGFFPFRRGAFTSVCAAAVGSQRTRGRRCISSLMRSSRSWAVVSVPDPSASASSACIRSVASNLPAFGMSAYTKSQPKTAAAARSASSVAPPLRSRSSSALTDDRVIPRRRPSWSPVIPSASRTLAIQPPWGTRHSVADGLISATSSSSWSSRDCCLDERSGISVAL